VERLREAAERDEVRAVVLRVDSPGGSALASDLMLQEIRRLRDQKPVVVSMGETAASGGYYVAMEADEIWADPLSLTGSIGVFLLKPDLSGVFDKLGLRVESYRRGENANLFDTSRGFDATQRERLQEQLDRFYLRFVEQVADGRGLAVERAEEAARGRVWSGRRAVEIGLVDALGGEDAAIAAAVRLGGIDERVRPRIVTFQPAPRLMDELLQDFFAEETTVRSLPLGSVALRAHLMGPLRALDSFLPALDGTPQFLLPWRLRVR
jgi:protease-4